MAPAFNHDIYQEIALRLDLTDAISLLQVSSQLYSSFSLWHSVLSAAKRVRHLACSAHQDLSCTDFGLIRRIGYRTTALMRNWNNTEPDCKSFRYIATRDHVTLALLTGEELLISANVRTGSLEIDCWDLRTDCIVARMPISAIAIYPYHFAEYAMAGRHMIGLIAGSPNSQIACIMSLDYTDRNTISFRNKLQFLVKKPMDHTNLSMCITEDTATIIGSNMGPTAPVLLAAMVDFKNPPPSVSPGREIPVPIPTASTCIVQYCFSHEKVLYLVLKTPIQVICAVSPTRQVLVFPLEMDFPWNELTATMHCHPRIPHSVFYSVEQWVRHTDLPLASRIDHFFFRPLTLINDYPDFACPVFVPSTTYFKCEYPFTPSPAKVSLGHYNHITYIDYKRRGQIVPSASGGHALLHDVACPDHGSACFPILVFHPSELLHPSVHHLRIPHEVQKVVTSSILRDRFRKAFLDDRLGFLILDLEEGIYILSYI